MIISPRAIITIFLHESSLADNWGRHPSSVSVQIVNRHNLITAKSKKKAYLDLNPMAETLHHFIASPKGAEGINDRLPKPEFIKMPAHYR
jgi:hypothetical protein